MFGRHKSLAVCKLKGGEKQKMYLEDPKIEEKEVLLDETVLFESIEDPKMFSILVDKYQDAFVRKAKRILGDREEVYDVVQEAFTKIYVNANKFKVTEGATFNSWAYKILINTTLTYYQKLKRRGEISVALETEILELIPDGSTNFSERISARDLVAKSLSRMPESLAKILTLHYIDDTPQKDIARMEGISVSAVKTRIHRAKKAFKDLNKLSFTI